MPCGASSSLPLRQRHLQQVRHRVLGARRGCGRADDPHRKAAGRQQPGQIGESARLGVASGLREPTEARASRRGPARRRRRRTRVRVRARPRIATRRPRWEPWTGHPPRRGSVCAGAAVRMSESAMSTSGHRDTTVRFAPAMTSTLRSAMKPLMLQAVWTATWRLPVRCAVTFAMSVSVPAPTEISSRSAADLGDRALDRLLVGAHRARAELDDRAAELFGEPIDDRPGRRAVRPTVAENHRRGRPGPRAELGDRASSHGGADADVDVGQVGITLVAERREDLVRFGNGCHVGSADGQPAAPTLTRRHRTRRGSGRTRRRTVAAPQGRARWCSDQVARQPMPPRSR